MGDIIKSLLLFMLLSSCVQEDWSISELPLDCNLTLPTINVNHPKNQLYQNLIDEAVVNGIPGVVLLVRTTDDGYWIGNAGMSKIESDQAMQSCNVHHSASVAKTYMATAIMLLVEDGKIDLDAPIKTYLDKSLCDKIGNCNTATVRHLLNHTSGIRDFVTETNHLTDYFNDYFNEYTTEDFLSYIYNKRPLFRAGDKAQYSNTNSVLATLIIDNVTGKPHADFLTERIFKKFSLTETFYKNEEQYPRPTGLVNSYWDRYSNGHLENVSKVAIHFDKLSVGHDAMLATVYDFSKFYDDLLKGRIVSEASLVEMKKWKFDRKDDIFNGLGLLREPTDYGDAIGHGGGNFGVAMSVQHFPDHDATIVICTNISGFFPSPALDEVLSLKKAITKAVLE